MTKPYWRAVQRECVSFSAVRKPRTKVQRALIPLKAPYVTGLRAAPILWVILIMASIMLIMCEHPAALSAAAVPFGPPHSGADQEPGGVGVRRVNAPKGVSASEAAVFWFGRVTPTENYTDARIYYADESLVVHLGIIDRRLWYDPIPSANEITSWDSASLYLRRSGATDEVLSPEVYRFDAQLHWWEKDRSDFQAAYRGDGTRWSTADVPFTSRAGWNGNAPNDDVDDRGWMLFYTIPFKSLGLEGPPPQGTVWGLGLAIHDRDSAAGPPLADQMWPDTMDPNHPVTWGELRFGAPPVYLPPPVTEERILTLRHGLNNTSVRDADVGGSSVCGRDAWPEFFPTWGDLNYAGKEFINIQHVGPISEWPCYSKYYVTFPLSSLPTGKVIVSATLTLYQFGNAGEGWDPGPQPSYIEVLTVAEDWEESSLTWNNAPLAVENIVGSWIDPLDASPPWPGIPRQWDVSGAAVNAYASGEPLRLALYSPDWPLHSGKYFWSSDIGGGGAGRPTLTVLWGDPVSGLTKTAQPSSGRYGDKITYTLGIIGYGAPLILTDTLPSGVSAPESFEQEGTIASPLYDEGLHRLTWSDSPAAGQRVTITYSAQITTYANVMLSSTTVLRGLDGAADEVEASVLANPQWIALPCIVRDS